MLLRFVCQTLVPCETRFYLIFSKLALGNAIRGNFVQLTRQPLHRRLLTLLHIRRWILRLLRHIVLLGDTPRVIQVAAFPVLRVLFLESLERRVVLTFAQLDRTQSLAPRRVHCVILAVFQ